MARFWGWVWALLHAWGLSRAPVGMLAPALEAGARYRLRLLVSVARASLGLNGERLGLARLLEAAGWSAVRVYTAWLELPAGGAWSVAATGEAPAGAAAWTAWAEATWTGARPYAATLEGVTIMHVDRTLAELVAAPRVVVVAPEPVPLPLPAAVPKIGSVTARTRPEVRLTSHLPWEFFEALRDGCYARGWKPRGCLMVMMSESTLRANAHNRGWDPETNAPYPPDHPGAVGLIQFMPATLDDLKFHPSEAEAKGRPAWMVMRDDYGPIAQLPWVFRYYDTRSPRLVESADETAFYLATYHPRDNAHANDPGFVLSRAPSADYKANAGAFDLERKGWIQVSDLTRRVRSAASGAYWQEASARLQFVEDEGGGGGGIAAAAARAGAAAGIVAALVGLAWAGYSVARGEFALPWRLPA
jgi:hypothetical protein